MKTTTTIKAASVTLALALTAFAHADTARADSTDGVATKIVTYGDLNLDSPSGAKAFYSRVQSAARTVCSSLEGRDLNSQAAWHKCYNKAVASAVSQVSATTAVALNHLN